MEASINKKFKNIDYKKQMSGSQNIEYILKIVASLIKLFAIAGVLYFSTMIVRRSFLERNKNNDFSLFRWNKYGKNFLDRTNKPLRDLNQATYKMWDIKTDQDSLYYNQIYSIIGILISFGLMYYVIELSQTQDQHIEQSKHYHHESSKRQKSLIQGQKVIGTDVIDTKKQEQKHFLVLSHNQEKYDKKDQARVNAATEKIIADQRKQVSSVIKNQQAQTKLVEGYLTKVANDTKDYISEKTDELKNDVDGKLDDIKKQINDHKADQVIIDQKNKELAEKETQLTKADLVVEAQNKELAEKETQLKKDSSDLDAQNKELAEKETQLTKEDLALEAEKNKVQKLKAELKSKSDSSTPDDTRHSISDTDHKKPNRYLSSLISEPLQLIAIDSKHPYPVDSKHPYPVDSKPTYPVEVGKPGNSSDINDAAKVEQLQLKVEQLQQELKQKVHELVKVRLKNVVNQDKAKTLTQVRDDLIKKIHEMAKAHKLESKAEPAHETAHDLAHKLESKAEPAHETAHKLNHNTNYIPAVQVHYDHNQIIIKHPKIKIVIKTKVLSRF